MWGENEGGVYRRKTEEGEATRMMGRKDLRVKGRREAVVEGREGLRGEPYQWGVMKQE